MMNFTQLFSLLLSLAALASSKTTNAPYSYSPYTYSPYTYSSDDTPAGGLSFQYPFPVHFYEFASQQKHLSMAYMDVPPANGTTFKGAIALLHGKNFCGATWNYTAHVLAADGFRVIIPDQIGFCKSSKILQYQFSLHQLATNTNGLLRSLSITNATIMGHSMGGMIASRYALTFPHQTHQLVLVDPLGLEDWQAIGVPYQIIETSFQTELATTFSSIKAYQQATYYSGNWSPSYDIWVQMLMDVYQGPEGRTFAYDMALTTDMIFTEPIVYQLPSLTMKSLLIVGDEDNTAIGKTWAPANIKPLLGHYEVLGKATAARVPNMTLIEFPTLGHAPQVEDPVGFHAALLGWLGQT
ncbi:putative alpha beta hydrolase fold protein [Coleophoma crateriformis]|uniref:Putative alpha beta hydrolase fold protein n=1 Tax=Coleophoma crateriformis TaxID=565419 RepID=A0A3D8RWX3_9HELO|nr:putative alpha beta hydrolase fold protein [Coleophoma crateriformis]